MTTNWRWPTPRYFPWQEYSARPLHYVLPRMVTSVADVAPVSPICDNDGERAAAALLILGTEATLRNLPITPGYCRISASQVRLLMSAQAGQLRALGRLSRGVTVESLIDAHRTITLHNRSLRDGAVWMGGNGTIIDAATVAPPADLIRPYLENFIQVWPRLRSNRVSEIAFVYLQLTSIHPFWDGNGRLGRSLVAAKRMRNGSLLDAIALMCVIAHRRSRVARTHREAQTGNPLPMLEMWRNAFRAAQRLSIAIRERLNGPLGPDAAGYHPIELVKPAFLRKDETNMQAGEATLLIGEILECLSTIAQPSSTKKKPS